MVDPGEETGWSIWKDGKLVGGGQTKLGNFKHDVWDAVFDDTGPLSSGQEDLLHPGVDIEDNTGPFSLFVIEKFALYPWVAKSGALNFNEFRTVQLIGALQLIAERASIEVEKQSAQIKERAMAGGAGELFVRPLKENRHQNDSIMHGFFYYQVTKPMAEGKAVQLVQAKKPQDEDDYDEEGELSYE
jgi:hypothetical protein